MFTLVQVRCRQMVVSRGEGSEDSVRGVAEVALECRAALHEPKLVNARLQEQDLGLN